MKQQPSRILNEPSNFMGLTTADIMGLSVVFMLFQRLLYFFGLEFLAIIITLIAAVFLSVIRMKYRRKIIRDSLKYYYFKWVLSGFIYVQQPD
jgi:hypothetical protein